MKLLVCGDVHLTNYSDFNQPTNNPAIGTRLNNILTALYYFFDYGKQHDVDIFVINVILWFTTIHQGISPASISMFVMTIMYFVTAIMGKFNWKPTETK